MTWKRPFPGRFNVEYTWCVCREVSFSLQLPLFAIEVDKYFEYKFQVLHTWEIRQISVVSKLKILYNMTLFAVCIINLMTVKETIFQMLRFGVSTFFLILDFRTEFQLLDTMLFSVI